MIPAPVAEIVLHDTQRGLFVAEQCNTDHGLIYARGRFRKGDMWTELRAYTWTPSELAEIRWKAEQA